MCITSCSCIIMDIFSCKIYILFCVCMSLSVRVSILVCRPSNPCVREFAVCFYPGQNLTPPSSFICFLCISPLYFSLSVRFLSPHFYFSFAFAHISFSPFFFLTSFSCSLSGIGIRCYGPTRIPLLSPSSTMVSNKEPEKAVRRTYLAKPKYLESGLYIATRVVIPIFNVRGEATRSVLVERVLDHKFQTV